MVLGFSKVKSILSPSPYLVKIRTSRDHSEKLLCALSTNESFSPVVVNPQSPSEQARIQDLLSKLNNFYDRIDNLCKILDIELTSYIPKNDCSILPLNDFFESIETFLSNYEANLISLKQRLSDIENSIKLFSSLSDFLLSLDFSSADLFSDKTHTFTVVGTIPASYEELVKFYIRELTNDSFLYWSTASKDPRYKTIFLLSLVDYKDQVMHVLSENYYEPITLTKTSLELLNTLNETKNVGSLLSQLNSEVESIKNNLLTYKSSISNKLVYFSSLVKLGLAMAHLETQSHTTAESLTIWGWVPRKEFQYFAKFLDELAIPVDYTILRDVPFKYKKSPHPASLIEQSKSYSTELPRKKEPVPELSKRGRHTSSHPLFPKESLFVKFEVPLKHTRSFISLINSLGILQPVKLAVVSDNRSAKLTSIKAEFEGYKSRIQQLISQLAVEDTENSLTTYPNQKISLVDDYKHSKAFILNILNEYEPKISELYDKKHRLEQKINQLKFYLPFEKMFSEHGIKLNFLESGLHTFVILGSIPERHYSAVKFFLREVTDNNALFWFSETSVKGTDDRKNIFIVALNDYKDAILRVLNEYNFEQLDITELDLEKVMSTSDIIESLSKELDIIKENLSNERKSIGFQLLAALELINTELKRIEVEEFGQIIDNNFVLWGWIPATHKSKIEKLKEDFGKPFIVEYNHKTPLVAPSITVSGKVFGVFRGLVDGLGVPNPHEVDPYFFIRFTFPILFGIMFADLAHGLMLVLIGSFLTYKKKKKKIKPDESITGYLYKGAGLLIYTGLFAMLFGLLFGTFLGDEELLPELYAQLGLHWLPVILYPLHQVKTLLAFSLIIGFVLMQFVIWLRVLQNIRYGHDKASILAPIFLSIFYVGLFAILYNLVCKDTIWHYGAIHLETGEIVAFKSLTFPTIPPLAIKVFVVITLVSMVLVFIMEYLHKKTDGIMEAIDHVLALLSNTLSFSRLMALLLVHAILASIPFRLINNLIPLSPMWWVAGLLMGIIIIVPLEGLLSFLNSLRLHWVELFNKFYVGDGIPYKPIKVSYSYIKLEEPNGE